MTVREMAECLHIPRRSLVEMLKTPDPSIDDGEGGFGYVVEVWNNGDGTFSDLDLSATALRRIKRSLDRRDARLKREWMAEMVESMRSSSTA